MGTIFERAGQILSSNIHALLDKCENPEKMLDESMREAVEDLAELKKSAAELLADQKAAQRNYDKAVRKMQAEHGFAVNAMKAGDEQAAARFLQSEASIRMTEADPALRNLETAKANFAKIQSAYNKRADDISFMKNQMNTIKGTIRAAKAAETVAAMKEDGGRYSESFDRHAEKAQRMLDVAQAKLEMNAEPADEMAGLRQKYAVSIQPDMSAALADLRAECMPDEKGCMPGLDSVDENAKEGVYAMQHALDDLRKEAGGN